jgi:hypothetical protein
MQPWPQTPRTPNRRGLAIPVADLRELRALTIPRAARVRARVAEALGLDPVRGVEVVALRKRLDSEVGEDRRQPLRHSCVVVGIAAATEREVDRPVERPQRPDIEVIVVERVHESAQTGGSLGHPWWWWRLGWG